MAANLTHWWAEERGVMPAMGVAVDAGGAHHSPPAAQLGPGLMVVHVQGLGTAALVLPTAIQLDYKQQDT